MAEHFKTTLDGETDHQKLHSLCKLTYKEQGVWFLNAFWEGGLEQGTAADKAEVIWGYVDKCCTIDNVKATGNALDEMEAHRFLEAVDEAITVLHMRSSLRKTGALGESERPKEVPLTHFLLFKFRVDWHVLVNAAQGDNSAQIAEAQDKLQAVQDAFDASTNADREATAALSEAKTREAAAKASEEAAIQRENEAKAAEEAAIQRENEAKAAEEAALQREAEAKAREEQALATEAAAKKAEQEALDREAEAKAAEADAVARENEAVARENEAKSAEADAVDRENKAKAAEADAISTEKEAVAKEEEAKVAEAPFKKAQEEVETALAEVKAQEDAYNQKTEQLKTDAQGDSVVKANRAKVSLDAHLAEDPLPLRKVFFSSNFNLILFCNFIAFLKFFICLNF